MAATEQTEIERKYEVDESARVPDLTVVDGVAKVVTHGTFTLSAVYYDTEGLDLAAHSISLRRREGGGDEGWHIKKPVAEGRTELHWPIDTANPAESGNQVASRASEDRVPDAVLEPARAIVRDREVSPVARVTTTRTAVHLLNDRDEAVAELADDKVRASDVRGGEFRAWREWEVEFLDAAPGTPEERTAFLDAVEAVLATAGAHPSASRSKLAHTLGANALTEAAGTGQAAAAPDAHPGTHAENAGFVVVRALRHQVNALIEADPLVRADEPDAVHGMRRTVRRLRSLLAAYEQLFDEDAVGWLRDGLKRLGAALGEVRDAEVRKARAGKLLDSMHAHDPQVRKRLIGTDESEYEQALDRLRRVLSGEQYYRLLDALEEFVQAPPLSELAARPADKEIPKEISRQVKRMLKRADAVTPADKHGAGHHDADAASDVATTAQREAAMHEVRKAARRLRYAITALKVPGMYKPGKKLRAIASAVKPIEKALGGHRDKVLFAEQVQLSAQRARAEGEDTYVYGVLTGSESDAAGSDQPQTGSGGGHTERLLRDLRKAMRAVDKLAHKL